MCVCVCECALLLRNELRHDNLIFKWNILTYTNTHTATSARRRRRRRRLSSLRLNNLNTHTLKSIRRTVRCVSWRQGCGGASGEKRTPSETCVPSSHTHTHSHSRPCPCSYARLSPAESATFRLVSRCNIMSARIERTLGTVCDWRKRAQRRQRQRTDISTYTRLCTLAQCCIICAVMQL